MDTSTENVATGPGVTEHQGIDLTRIKQCFLRMKAKPSDTTRLEFQRIADDVLELVEHVESDGLLTRVEAARKEMADSLLPPVY